MPGLAEGHSGEIVFERQIYASIASMAPKGAANIRTICEIGFNGGHSASLWLLAAPTAKVIMFDLFEHKYSPINEQLLRKEGASYGLRDVDRRLAIITGSSVETVPKFAQEHPDVQCDLLSVDGGHFGDTPQRDMKNMMRLANKQWHVLVIDDTNCDGIGCVDDRIERMRDEGQLKVIGRVAEKMEYSSGEAQQFHRGVTVLQYTAAYLATR